MSDVPPSHCYSGGAGDRERGERTEAAVLLKSARLSTHGVMVGMTGSGKTELGVVLLEEGCSPASPGWSSIPKARG